MAGHKHNWVLVNRKKTAGGKWLCFWECINPGCPNPHKAGPC